MATAQRALIYPLSVSRYRSACNLARLVCLFPVTKPGMQAIRNNSAIAEITLPCDVASSSANFDYAGEDGFSVPMRLRGLSRRERRCGSKVRVKLEAWMVFYDLHDRRYFLRGTRISPRRNPTHLLRLSREVDPDKVFPHGTATHPRGATVIREGRVLGHIHIAAIKRPDPRAFPTAAR